MGQKPLTPEEVKRRFEKQGFTLLSRYHRVAEKVKLQCCRCNYIYRTRPTVIFRGSGCPACLRPSSEEIWRRFKKCGFLLLSKYHRRDRKVRVECLKCGQRYKTRPGIIFSGHGCRACAQRRQSTKRLLSEAEVSRRLRTARIQLVEKYKGTRRGKNGEPRSKHRVQCLVCEHTWQVQLTEIFRGRSSCPRCHESTAEREVRKIIERITGWRFPKRRPFWLCGRTGRRLELDGYNARHKVAFEYQGPQHYKPSHGEAKLAETKKRDERKRVLCYQHGVLLIRVPYWKKDIEGYVASKLRVLL